MSNFIERIEDEIRSKTRHFEFKYPLKNPTEKCKEFKRFIEEIQIGDSLDLTHGKTRDRITVVQKSKVDYSDYIEYSIKGVLIEKAQ